MIYPNLAINQIWTTNLESTFYIYGYTLKTKYKNLAIFFSLLKIETNVF
jgi:hypothetical protein